jgi:hypothetical protein
MSTVTISHGDTKVTTDVDTLGRLARTVVLDAMPAAVVDPAPAGSDEVTGEGIRAELAHAVRPPMDAFFGAEDFLPGPTIEDLADRLIDDFPELSHLLDIPISYLWKRKGGASQGNPNLGKCTALSGAARYFGKHDFLVWLAADHVRDAALTPAQREALLYHQLRHIGEVLDENETSPTYGETKIKLIGHDFEGFWSELQQFGPWSAELRTTVNTIEQLKLTLDEESE